jgi:hypothetical protein
MGLITDWQDFVEKLNGYIDYYRRQLLEREGRAAAAGEENIE